MTALKRTSNMNALCKSFLAILSLMSMITPGYLATNVTYAEILMLKVNTVPCKEGWDSELCYCEQLENDTIPIFIMCVNISSAEQLQDVLAEMGPPPNLRYFTLMRSPIKVLPAGVFANQTFEGMEFLNNSIEIIEPGAFQGVEKTLTDIIFHRNQFKTIDFIDDLPLLKRIYFIKESMCEEIPDYAFVDQQLSFVHFDECALRSVGNYAFANTTGDFLIRDNKGPITKFGDNVFSNALGLFALGNVTDDSFSNDTFIGVTAKELQVDGLTMLKEEIFSPLLENIRSDKEYIFRGPMKCDNTMDWLAGVNGSVFNVECENGKSLEENISERNN